MSHVALALLAVLPLLSGGAANLRHARFVHTSRDQKGSAHVQTHGAHRVDGRQGGAHFKKSRKASIETPEAIEAILRSFSVQARELGNKLGMKHEMETERLAAAMNATSDNPTSIALSASMTTNDNNFKDAHKITSSIQRYAKDFTMVLEATNEGGATCKDINCGVHAACTNTMLGAQCVCNEGYVGDGQNCNAPVAFVPNRLLQDGISGISPKVADIHVAVFAANRVVSVWRDESHAGAGRMMTGDVAGTGVIEWGAPEKFTWNGKAYDPVVVGTPMGNSFVVVWRDNNKHGTCWMRAGVLGATGIRGADLHITWGQWTTFCENQAHRMTLMSLPPNKVVVIYPDRTQATLRKVSQSFGNSILVDVGSKGELVTVGNFNFAEQPLTRVEVTKLTPSSFVIGARSAPAEDEMNPGVQVKQEAVAIFGELMDGDKLVYDPNSLSIEPQATDIWARGLGLVAPNTFGYAYQMGKTLETRLAVVHVDPSTHKMRTTMKTAIHQGNTDYVQMIPVPYTASDPHTFVYYRSQDPKTGAAHSSANICTVTKTGEIKECEEFPWLLSDVSSVSAARLGSGRSLFVFTNKKGVPFYSVVGVAKKW